MEHSIIPTQRLLYLRVAFFLRLHRWRNWRLFPRIVALVAQFLVAGVALFLVAGDIVCYFVAFCLFTRWILNNRVPLDFWFGLHAPVTCGHDYHGVGGGGGVFLSHRVKWLEGISGRNRVNRKDHWSLPGREDFALGRAGVRAHNLIFTFQILFLHLITGSLARLRMILLKRSSHFSIIFYNITDTLKMQRILHTCSICRTFFLFNPLFLQVCQLVGHSRREFLIVERSYFKV